MGIIYYKIKSINFSLGEDVINLEPWSTGSIDINLMKMYKQTIFCLKITYTMSSHMNKALIGGGVFILSAYGLLKYVQWSSSKTDVSQIRKILLCFILLFLVSL